MGNSPVDKSESFKESGMTLITEVGSDVYLKKSTENNEVKEETNDQS